MKIKSEDNKNLNNGSALMQLCPCGSHTEFSKCCSPIIEHKTEASTPEQLMRARYSAFCTKNMDFIFDSTHPQARFEFDRKANEEWADQAEFLRLEILSSSADGNKGIVDFKAHFKLKDSEPAIHHEIASFRKQEGTWYFRDARLVKTEK